MLDPLRTTSRIRDEYRRYLRSTFPLRRPELAAAFTHQLEHEFRLTQGPLLQASPPYVSGSTVRDLVTDGVLNAGFLRLAPEAFPIDRPLYLHQEQALRKAVGGRRNLVVATGTGSGKTECFLLPVLDHLMREREEKSLRKPGVRALLLYPMNALANDQLKRLRTLLAGSPDITFGRYVGETQYEPDRAEQDFRNRYPSEPRLPNELISREAMQENPPHILLTNFAMLEYLLLRPHDSTLFDGPTGEHWRFVALDEVHVYSGASGSEIAMLLRRVRDRVNGSARGRLQCFGTSATLGRGARDYPELVSFGEALFDEPFEWHSSDTERQDVIGATRRAMGDAEAEHRLADEELQALHDVTRAGGDVVELVAASGLTGRQVEGGDAGEVLTEILARDERVLELQRRLESGSVDLSVASRELFDGPAASERLVSLVDLCVHAKPRPDDAPLIPARYHFFLRALEGAFLCRHPDHDSREPSLLLSRHEQCPSCTRAGRTARMFELGVCRRCGSEYLVGALEPSADGLRQLAQASPFSTHPIRVLLGDALADDEDDEDQDLTQAAAGKATAALLCPGCGAVSEHGDVECRCAAPPARLRVWVATDARETGALRRCISCAYRSAGDPVYRFLTGSDAPVSVIATDLYQELPPSRDPALRDEIGEGRKLLTFSDSRQDAAFFAPFLERTYRRAVERRLIAQSVDVFGDEQPRTDDLIDPVRREAERSLVLNEDDGAVTNKRLAATWLTRELLALDRRQGLEGTGVAEIALALPKRYEPPRPLLALGFTTDEATDLLRLLLDTLRHSGAISVLEGVDVRDPAFAPRNREIFVRGNGVGPGILAWSPARNLNGRLDILQRVFARRAITADPREVLSGTWKYLTDRNGAWDKVLVASQTSDGPLWRIAAERYVFLPGVPARSPLQCSRCQQLWWRSVADVCPAFRCDGTLSEVDDPEALSNDHYARLYRDLKPVGMAVEEHTAQWVSSKASEIQDDFIRGRINVLSCSTTFELGVDVGDVEAVLLRNVPPSPANYVQRAGRAGRRTDAAALVVTFAQRRSHDLTFFDRPQAMVDGTIPPPRIVLENAPIARRHLHSLAFAAFQREVGDHRTVEDFFLDVSEGRTRHDQFLAWLRGRPDTVGDAARRVVPAELSGPLGLDGWQWVEALEKASEDDPTQGWLGRAADEITEDAESLDALVDDAASEQKFPRAQALKTVRTALVKRHLISFLASRNVLPKYGFPVDVVELQLGRSGDRQAASLELTRDLKLAIADYSPGAMTVAGKQLWKSTGLVTRQDRKWPTYAWATCNACGSFVAELESDPTVCAACHGTDLHSQGRFVIPLYGFTGERAEAAGETRPIRLARVQTYFGSYREDPPPFESVAGLTDVELRFSRQGRITVVNEGPMGAGFRVCEWCGWGEPIALSGKAKKTHRRPDRPGQECRGPLLHLGLGHEYLTDVLEVRVTNPADASAARSALYALLEAAPALDVAREDIDGTLSRPIAGQPAFVLFDAVPGGAGHTQRLGRGLLTLVGAARERVSTCECGVETSCYACLRSYSNQIFHEELRRGDAMRVLDAMLGH